MSRKEAKSLLGTKYVGQTGRKPVGTRIDVFEEQLFEIKTQLAPATASERPAAASVFEQPEKSG